MNIRLTGASLAIAATAGIAVLGFKKKASRGRQTASVEIEDGRKAIVLGPMKADPSVNVMVTEDDGEFVAFFRGSGRYEELWRGPELNIEELSSNLVEIA